VADIIDFDPTPDFGVGTIGEPGARQFFLRGGDRDHTLVMACEKAHVQGLTVRIRQLLEEQGVELGLPDPRPPQPAEPASIDWRLGELGLGWHDQRERFVIVVREVSAEEGAELAAVRFWLTQQQVVRFLAQAESVLSQGRPICPNCGLPIDPGGHPCPAANGSRPVF
jgi:uncharacterized repeat protein (TIGR03847 family)